MSEFGSKGSQTRTVASSKSVFEDDVCALDPAEFAQFLSERRMIDGGLIQRRRCPTRETFPDLFSWASAASGTESAPRVSPKRTVRRFIIR